jgi:hypothetical protein
VCENILKITLISSCVRGRQLQWRNHPARWDDADAIRILESWRREMKPDSRLVVIEAFFAESGEQIPANMIDTQVPLFDLHLMLAVNGKERGVAGYSVLFDKVGLRTIKTTPLDNGYVVIETAPA